MEITIWQSVKSTEKSLERTFPPEKSARYIPPSLEEEASYSVHVVEFLNSIKVELKNAAAWNAVGSYYFYSNPGKAKEAYERAIMYAPDDPSGYTNLGMWYRIKAQDSHSALQNFQKATKVAEERGLSAPWAYVGIASVPNKPDRVQAAAEKGKQQFEAAVTADPSDFWAFYGLGWCWRQLAADDRTKAIHYMEEALKLKPDFATARYNLACYKALNGDTNGTVEELSRILEPLKPMLEIFGFPKDRDFDRVRDDAAFKAFAKMLGY
jgi:tetratricopeptide (TPR) repeat protein